MWAAILGDSSGNRSFAWRLPGGQRPAIGLTRASKAEVMAAPPTRLSLVVGLPGTLDNGTGTPERSLDRVSCFVALDFLQGLRLRIEAKPVKQQ